MIQLFHVNPVLFNASRIGAARSTINLQFPADATAEIQSDLVWILNGN